VSYYQGDFYQGDPGFLSGLGRIFGSVGKMAAGFIPGAGPFVQKGIGLLERAGQTRVGRAIMKHPTLSAAGGAGLLGGGMGLATGRMGRGASPLKVGPGMGMAAGGVTRGMHISKRTGQLVRNRRMRVTNPKALRRAIRRAKGFERLARKVMHFTSPRRVKGRAIFRVRRRAK